MIITDEEDRKRVAANSKRYRRRDKAGKKCVLLPMDRETIDLSLCKAKADTLKKQQQCTVLAEICEKLLRDYWLFVSNDALDDGLRGLIEDHKRRIANKGGK